MLQINVEQIKTNKGFYLYLYFFGDLASLTKLPWRFQCAHQPRKLLKKLVGKFFLVFKKLQMKYELTKI